MVSRIPVPSTDFSVQLDTIDIQTNDIVAFTSRSNAGAALSATVGDITGSPQSNFTVDEYTEVYIATKYPSAVSELSIKTSIHVSNYGKLELPENVVVERDHVLEICGTLMTKTNNLFVRDAGIVRVGSPAQTGSNYASASTNSRLNFDTLVVDYNGKFEHSSKCMRSDQSTDVLVNNFNVSAGYSISSPQISLEASNTNEISPLLNATCDSSTDLLIYRDTQCELSAKAYSYNSIVIEAGGKLILTGDPQGKNVTKITVSNLEIKYGGTIDGKGKGYSSGGPGQPSSGSSGASHGGAGRNTADPTSLIYGSIVSPKVYGSNGYGATSSSGTGGGQIELVVTNKFTLNGDIDVSGSDSSTSGGSGGSILVTSWDMTGTGTLTADGGAGGGGGGRISLTVTGTYTYGGEMSVAGNDASPGKISNKWTFYDCFINLPNIKQCIL